MNTANDIEGSIDSIRTLIAGGSVEQALDEVERLLAHTDPLQDNDTELHLLRIELLLRAWTRLDALVLSFEHVRGRLDQQDEAVQHAYAALRARLEARFHEEQHAIEEALRGDQLPLLPLERLAPLASLFPSLYLALAEAHMTLHADLAREASPTHQARAKRALNVYVGEPAPPGVRPLLDQFDGEDDSGGDDLPTVPRRVPELVHLFKADRAWCFAHARIMLNHLHAHLPPDDPRCGRGAALLAEWHERANEWEAALTHYERAASLGMGVRRQIERARLMFAQDLLTKVITAIDACTAVSDPLALDKLLRAASVFASMPIMRLARGDGALMSGDLETAKTAYIAVIDQPQRELDEVLRSEEVAPESLVRLRHWLEHEAEVTAHPTTPPAHPAEHPLYVASHVPTTLLAQRATAALAVVVQQQGDDARAAALLSRLLGDPALPREAAQAAAAAFERLERQSARRALERERHAASDHAAAGRWTEARAAFYRVCGLPYAETVDYAWLALCLLRTGADAAALAEVWARTQPADLAALPTDDAESLLDALLNDGRYELVGRSADSDTLSSAWKASYRARLEGYTAGLRAHIDESLTESRWQHAAEASQRLLRVSGAAGDKLRLARALLGAEDLAEAAWLLQALASEQDETVRDEVALLQIDLDLARGYLDEARRRLASLEARGRVGSTRVVQTIINRLERQPAYRVGVSDSTVAEDSLRRAPAPTACALFAVRLVSVRAARDLPPIDAACARFLQAISQRGGVGAADGLPVHYTWRTISRGGRLTIALLVRVEAPTTEMAQARAMRLWRLLENALPLQNDVFGFEPVCDALILDDLLTPCAFHSAAEIARRELTITTPLSDPVYLVYPFALERGSLRRALALLASQPQTTLIDIHLMPTTLFPWERSAISQMMQSWAQAQNRANSPLFMADALPELMEVERGANDFRQGWVGSLYPDFLQRTGSTAFVVQIQLASAATLDPALPDVVGMELFGTSVYDIAYALSDADLTIIRRNLSDVQCERWIYSAAPASVPRWRHLLTPDEALTAARLPTPDSSGLPGIPSLKLRTAVMPERFDSAGVVVGESIFPVNGRPVQVKASMSDRLRHVYMVGRTGTGKSTLIQNMALQDIEAGRGVGVIDPHGDLFSAIMARIPPHRVQDVVVFDPSDEGRPVALNILDLQSEFERNMMIADFLGLLYSLFDPGHTGIIGPRFENIVRHSMLAVMETTEGATLLEVVRMITDKDFRDGVIRQVKDPLTKNYWDNVGHNLDNFGWNSGKGEMVDWVASKFGRFVDDHIMRPIIGQSRNTMDFEAIMNEQKILLVDLSKGKLGPEASKFIGLLLVPRLLIAAHRRTRLPAHLRSPFCLYVDEFQNFTTPAFAEMLSEARKYGVALTVANQFTSQLDPYVREAVFGNVGTMLVFQVGIRDAALLSPEMYPATTDDIINLPNFHLLAKMLISGDISTPFPVRTLADTRVPNPDIADAIRASSRQRYGRDAALIRHEIAQRFYKQPKEKEKKSGMSFLDTLNT
jgi:hypothetical protein